MDNVHRHGGHGYGCDLGSCKNDAMTPEERKWNNWLHKASETFLILIFLASVVALVAGMCKSAIKHDAPAINYEAVIQSKSDSLERVVQQLQDCRKDLLRQDTIIMDQRSYIEQLEGLKKARPPNR